VTSQTTQNVETKLYSLVGIGLSVVYWRFNLQLIGNGRSSFLCTRDVTCATPF